MDINYSIDGGATVTMPVNNINFSTGDIYTFNHSTSWNPHQVVPIMLKYGLVI